MKITNIRTFVIDGGMRFWVFVKIETDEGIVGWGDASDWEASHATTRAVEFLAKGLIGENPLNVEKIWWRNSQIYHRAMGGIAWKAMSGIDTALMDIKGKALGVPVYQLLGGKMRDKLRLYWTHCGTSRLAYSGLLKIPHIDSLKDLEDFCKNVVAPSGFTGMKTNILPLEGTPLRAAGETTFPPKAPATGMMDKAMLKTLLLQMQVIREALGDDFDIMLDVGPRFRGQSVVELARALEPLRLLWLETETFSPTAQAALHNSTVTPIVHGESLYDLSGYLPFLQLHAQSGLMVDLAWNGLTMGKKIADLALAYDCTISPHCCHSILSTYVAMHYSAAIKNFAILEFDNDDVPWRDDIATHPLEIKDGYLTVSDRPGLGTDLIESEMLKHRVKEISLME